VRQSRDNLNVELLELDTENELAEYRFSWIYLIIMVVTVAYFISLLSRK